MLLAHLYLNLCNTSGTPTQLCRAMSWHQKGLSWYKALGLKPSLLGMLWLETQFSSTCLLWIQVWRNSCRLETIQITGKMKVMNNTTSDLSPHLIPVLRISAISLVLFRFWRPLVRSTWIGVSRHLVTNTLDKLPSMFSKITWVTISHQKSKRLWNVPSELLLVSWLVIIITFKRSLVTTSRSCQKLGTTFSKRVNSTSVEYCTRISSRFSQASWIYAIQQAWSKLNFSKTQPSWSFAPKQSKELEVLSAISIWSRHTATSAATSRISTAISRS